MHSNPGICVICGKAIERHYYKWYKKKGDPFTRHKVCLACHKRMIKGE